MATHFLETLNTHVVLFTFFFFLSTNLFKFIFRRRRGDSKDVVQSCIADIGHGSAVDVEQRIGGRTKTEAGEKWFVCLVSSFPETQTHAFAAATRLWECSMTAYLLF